HFKRINDTCGHVKGDRVLVEVATVVSANVRGEDVVARYGGEEFVVLLPHIAELGALAAAEKIRGAVAAQLFPEIEAAPVTISLGLVTFHGDQPGTATIDTVLMLAD